ncbi:MFS transporter permease [Thermodesulfobacteriota bacterium]
MTKKKLEELVIPKEKAVFWLDKHGFWHTEMGKFENRKIIEQFHSSIKMDGDGYYLEQEHRHYREKVYFPYEDTALFIFHVLKGDEIILVLNTGRRVKLKPRRLFIKGDFLYMYLGKERIKFAEMALITVSDYMEDKDGRFFINVNGRRYLIPEEE